MAVSRRLSDDLEFLLTEYSGARAGEQFSSKTDAWRTAARIEEALRDSPPVQGRPNLRVRFSLGQGNWAKVPWIALLDERETDTTRHGVYCVYLFREDMSGVYLTFNQGVTEPIAARGRASGVRYIREKAAELQERSDALNPAGFSLDDGIDLRTGAGLGRDYELSTIAYKFYGKGDIPDDEALLLDLEACLSAYDNYLQEPRNVVPPPRSEDSTLGDAVEALIAAIAQRGFVYEPWQVAAFVAAVRTKPFVILAGITGTGKSKLPAIVAEITGAESRVIPVRPDWTDSSDVLGYSDLQGRFRPGAVLEVARDARDKPSREWFCIIDEMNIARVEQYFAEVLSRIEDRRATKAGGFETPPLLTVAATGGEGDWDRVGLSANLALVGTVNMDESSQTFSRKVLDRAFTLELSDVDLATWRPAQDAPAAQAPFGTWDVSAWYPRAVTLSSLGTVTTEDEARIEEVIRVLTEVNGFLITAQLQVGYRTRDEMALFVLHASETESSFVDRQGRRVDPVDLALNMKVLPRVIGGSGAIRTTLLHLLGWAAGGTPLDSDSAANDLVDRWGAAGQPTMLAGSRYPRTAARLCLMWDRLQSEGFTSYWL